MNNVWKKVDIFTTSEGIEALSDALTGLGHHSLSVVDSADLEKLMEGKYGAWDYIDPELMKLREAKTTVTLYISSDEHEQEKLSALHQMLIQLKTADTKSIFGSLECDITNVIDENWADTWKDDYNPVLVGEKFVISPSWVNCDPCGRILLKIDPGMAFGTGLDETTQLCLEALEETVKTGDTVLDFGCGSGILSIAAILLGADSALGVDIDEVAVKTAKENAELNGVSNKTEFICKNLQDKGTVLLSCSHGGTRQKNRPLVLANIAADIIIELIPLFPEVLTPKGTLILSGIIKDRKQDVVDALKDKNFSIQEYKEKHDWICIIAII